MLKYLKTVSVILIVSMATLLVLSFDTGQSKNISTKKPRNIIIMVGDGMGLTQITAARYKNGGKLHLDEFNHIGLITTHSADNLVTDSGAGATAFASGVKTKNGYIGVDADKNEVKNLFEIAKERGYKTGIIATSSITHATPAAFSAHHFDREDEYEIALQQVNSGVDLMIGGGTKYFFERPDGKDLATELRMKGYKVYGKLKKKLKGEKVMVLAADEAMVPVLRSRGTYLEDAWLAMQNYFPLVGQGFIAMIEGSQIDWGAHQNSLEYTLTELIDFDNTIGKVLEYAKMEGSTLVIVLADHETGGMSITSGDVTANKVVASWANTKHSATMIPVFAFGPGAENFSGIYDNTDIFKKVSELMR